MSDALLVSTGFVLTVAATMWCCRLRKPLAPEPPPHIAEILTKQDRLKRFLRDETSLGCYGSKTDIDESREAMRFLSYLDIEGMIEIATEKRGEGCNV